MNQLSLSQTDLLLLWNAALGAIMAIVHAVLARRYAVARTPVVAVLLAITAVVCAAFAILYALIFLDTLDGGRLAGIRVSRALVLILFILVTAVRAIELGLQEHVAKLAMRWRRGRP